MQIPSSCVRGVLARAVWWQNSRLMLALTLGIVLGQFHGVSFASQIALSWQDHATNESGFKIERATDGATFTQVAQVAANVTAYADTTVSPSTTYWFRVRAFNGAGDSGYTNIASAVTPVTVPTNTAPTISDVSNRTIAEDASSGAIAFIVADAQSAATALTVTASSSNTTLVPANRLTLGGSGDSRTLTVLPAANQSGTATITVTVSDGALYATDTFTLTVTASNDAPTISNLADRAINSGSNTGAIACTVGDIETAAGSLTLSATSSNSALVATSGMTFGGSGANRTLTVAAVAGQAGSTTISVRVSDGTATSTDTFVLTVNAGNTAPTISNLTDRAINSGGNTGAIAFTVADGETAAGSLTLSATSSNSALVATSGMTFGGSGANRTLTVTAVAGQVGTTTISVRVSDGAATSTDTFVLTVNAGNTAPTISDISSRTTAEDTAAGAISFTVGDAQTAASSLVVTATSSNTTLVPASRISLGGSGASRTLSVSPAANQSGTATISVAVSDGSLTAVDTFTLTVTAVNDAPALSAVTPRTLAPGGSTGAIALTVSDVETSAASLVLSGTSSNLTLVPNSAIVFGGSGGNRTVTVTPVATGTGVTTITLQVSDGVATGTQTFTVAVEAVSQNLTWADIGSPALAGSTTVKGSGFEVSAAGTNIGGTSDQFRFGSRGIVGDAEITVRVASLKGSNWFAKGGLMFRTALTADAANVGVFVSPIGAISLQWRATRGGQTSTSPLVWGTAPEWLRLMRTGDDFYAFRSDNGVDWELVEFVHLDLPDTAFGGIALTSRNSRSRTTAVFDSFEID